MKRQILLLLTILNVVFVSAQTNYRLTGYTIDTDSSGEWISENQFTYSYTGERGGSYEYQLYPYFRGELNFDEGLENVWMEDMYDPQYQRTRIYDAEDLVTEEITLAWNLLTTTYDNYQQEIFTNLDSKLIQKNKNVWDGSVYDPVFEIDYIYSGELLTQRIEKTFTGSEYENSSQTLFTYDASGNYTSVEVQNWVVAAWQDFLMYQYTYDGSGNCTNITVERKFGSGLESYYKTDYNYTAGILSSYEVQLYDGSDWVENYLTEVYWDANGNLSEMIRKIWNDVSEYVNDSRYLFTYEAYDVTSIELSPLIKLNISPNPTTDVLQVQSLDIINSIEVYDITGELKFSETINASDISIDLKQKSLMSGIYFIEVKTQTGSVKQKIILM